MESTWGRIAADGTVFVRTADGERPIGSWQAGSAEEGLAFYTRRYDDLAAEVSLLESRAASPASDVKAVDESARRLRAGLADVAAIGDLVALDQRLDGVFASLDARRAEQAAARARAAAAAADAKRALVEQAQQLSASEDWRRTGDRYRALVEEWKGIRGVDRRTDTELWEQFASARRSFERRRRAHFAEVEQQRAAATERKEELIREAEKLADSSDWAATAKRFRELMTSWKAAGRASREAEDALWQRFKAAQDAFFTRRSEAFAARDATLRANLEAKEGLLREAESLDVVADPEGARNRLRSIHDRWDKVGHVPRERMTSLEARLGAVERRLRDASAAARQVEIPESPLVIRLRESVTKLEARLQRAQTAGDDALVDETVAALATQREWLSQAEASS